MTSGRVRAFYLKLILAFFGQVQMLAQIPPQSSANRDTVQFSKAPSSVSPSLHVRDGKQFQLLVEIPGCDPLKPQSVPNDQWAIVTLSGVGVMVQGAPTMVPPCEMLTSVTIDPTASTGLVPIFVRDAKGSLQKAGCLTIVDAVPGPIPPGIAPQVDVLWTVQAPGITKDTFGRWVSKKYYAIEVVVGNNTGFELQVAGIAFQLRNPNGTLSPLDSVDQRLDQWLHAPTNDYHVVRATPEREQTAGPRAYTLSIAAALSLFGSGLTPFFKNVGHQATYSIGVAVFGTPVTKGLSLVWPDLTVQDLNRLDNLTLHDNVIIPNNSQIRTVVFLDRNQLHRYFDRRSVPATKPHPVNTEMAQAGPCNRVRNDTPRVMCGGDSPDDVKYWLGNLILVGDEIEYKQRIHVPSSQPTSVPVKITVSPGNISNAVLASANGQTITLTGANGGDISDVSAPPQQPTPGLTLTLDPVAQDKSTRTGTLRSGTLLTPGPYAVWVAQHGGTETLNVNVTLQSITLAPNTAKAGEFQVGNAHAPIDVTGENLESVNVTITPSFFTVTRGALSSDKKQMQITLTPTRPVTATTFDIAFGQNQPSVQFNVSEK